MPRCRHGTNAPVEFFNGRSIAPMENIPVSHKAPRIRETPTGAFEWASSISRNFDRGRFLNALIGVSAACVFLLFAASQINHFGFLFGPEAPSGSEYYADFASTLSKFVFFSLLMVLFVVRKRPIKKAKGLMPQLAALSGTFMFAGVALLPQADPTPVQSAVGLTLVCIGSVLSVYVINFLGRSFSLMAEARELVTKGPYAFVRHPLYLVEEIVVLGIVVQFYSLPVMLMFFLHIGVQIQRMKNEETVLKDAFSGQYAAYMGRTSRLIPGVY